MDGDSCPACFLSLVIPAYNEADGIAAAVHEADAALAKLGHSYEIIVVDDGSRDRTSEQVAEAAATLPAVRLLRHATNQGYGAALRSGFTAARGERIAFTDADCQFDLADLANLLELAEQNPIAVGYRLDRQDSRLRKFYSRGYNWLARTLLGTRVRDIDCALKVFRKEALAQILPISRGFFVNTEMLTCARQRHLRVVETGVRHRPRVRGASKVSLRDIPRTLNALVPFWWSKVMFPRRQLGVATASGGKWPDLFVLLVMAAVLFCGRLGAPLLEPEEARYAEIPRQMLSEGRLLTPILHGETYYQKPPLLYWLVMTSYAIFGVHDWAARLAPCGAALGVILITYVWAARTAGRAAALASAAILCLSAKFVYQAGMLTFDSPLCFFVIASLACAWRALQNTTLQRGWWLLAAGACALGILTKGPVALALVVPPVLLWQWLEPGTARVTWRGWAAFFGTAAALAGPWFVVVAWQDPAALGDFFWLHNLVRYVAPLDHEEPLWFYLPGLLVGMLPWSLLLAPLAIALTKRSPSAARRRPAALGFFLLCCAWCVLFFSLSGCKRAGYILPAYPLLALALGTFVALGILPQARSACASRLNGAVISRRIHPAWLLLVHRATLATLGLGFAVSGAAALRGLWPWPAVVVADMLLLAAFLTLWRRGPSRGAWAALTCGGTVFVLLVIGVYEILPMYHGAFGLRRQVRRQFDLAQNPNLPVASYPKRWDSISFYLERNDVDVYTPSQRAEMIRALQNQGQTLLFVKQGEALQDLLSTLPGDLEFVPRGRPDGKVVAGLVQAPAAPRRKGSVLAEE